MSPQGGTITSVQPAVNGGLTGGGTGGAVSLGLLTSCGSGQILKWGGTSWACSADAGGFDTAGAGLTSTGSTIDVGAGTGIQVNANDIALNMAGATCSSGSFISALGATGTGTCTTIAAGGGVTGTGTNGRSTRWTGTSTIGDGAWTDDGNNAAITGGAVGTLSVNGIHLAFNTNVGTISSTQPGTANRELDIQGTPLHLNVGGSTEIALDGSTATIAHDLDVNSSLSKFGATDGLFYIDGAGINAEYATNGLATLFVNYKSYANGTTQFRNLDVMDGKGALACEVTGSTKVMNCVGGMQENGTAVLSGTITDNYVPKGVSGNLGNSSLIDDGATVVTTENFTEYGNATLGNATTDSHTIYGAVNLTDTEGATLNQWQNGLNLVDDTGFATGVGASLNLAGKYNTAGGLVNVEIKAAKTNATDGNYSMDMVFATTPNGGVLTERMRISDQGVVSVPGSITEAGSPVLSGTITSNTIPKGSGGNLADSSITDNGSTVSTTENFVAGDTTSDAHVVNGRIQFVGDASSRFVYLSDTSTNFGVIYDSGGKMRFGGAATVGGAVAIESFEISPNVAAATALGTFAVNGNTTLGDAITDSHTITGQATLKDSTGAAVDYSGGDPALVVVDTTSMAQGVGGGLRFDGAFTGTTITGAAAIRAAKTNGTDSNYSFDLVFLTRPHGSGFTERMRISDQGVVSVPGSITEAGAAVLSGTITSNTLPKGSGGNLVDSGVTDDGSALTVAREIIAQNNIRLSAANDDYIYASGAASSGNQNVYITAAGTGTVRINHNGGGLANGGTGGLIVYGGANSATAQVTLASNGNLTAIGNTALGDSTSADSTTINGRLVANQVPGSSAGGEVFTNTPSALASDVVGLNVLTNGTVNTTAAVRTVYGAYIQNATTRSSGANNAVNIAAFVTSAGAQSNYAIETYDGDVLLNANSGNTLAANNLTVGDAAGDVFDVNGTLSKFGSSADGLTYINNDELDYGFDQNTAYTGFINYHGYNQGTTQFRNLSIRDGKGAEIMLLDGATHNITLNTAATGSTTAVGNFNVNGNTTLGDADSDAHILQGTVTAKRSTTVTTFSSTNANLFVFDTQTAAQGVGGDIAFYGCYNGTGACTTTGLIKGMKVNGSTSDYDFNLSLGTRRNGLGDVTERLRIDATGATNALGEVVGVKGTHTSSFAPDIADLFYSGFIRKNLSLYSHTVGNDTAADGNWRHANGTATLAWTTTTDSASPYGYDYTDTVGQITCTGATCTSSGAYYHYIATSTTTGIADLRSKTMTVSMWVKMASGTSTLFEIALGRYNDNDISGTTCTVNSTTWTRCSFTKTFNSTSYTDNSELRARITPQSTTAFKITGAQIELGSDPTPLEETFSAISSGASTFVPSLGPSTYVYSIGGGGAGYDYNTGVWSVTLGVGGEPQQPNLMVNSSGQLYAPLIYTPVLGIGAEYETVEARSVVGNMNDMTINAATTTMYVTPSGAYTITGINPGSTAGGRVLTVCNVGANDLTLAHESASSSAANRMELSGNVNWTLHAWTTGQECITLRWDVNAQSGVGRWRMTDHAGVYMPLLTVSGAATLNGATTIDVAGATDDLSVNKSYSAITGTTANINVQVGSTYDTTTVPLSSYGIKTNAFSSRSAGSNALTNYGVWSSASGGQTNYSGYFDAGTFQVNGSAINLGDANTDVLTINAKVSGHVYSTGTAPTLSTCGTSPSIVGNDHVGKIVTGTGGPTACTLTFATAWTTNAPICTVNVQNSTFTGWPYQTAQSTSAITWSFGAGATSQTFYYICEGYL